MEVLFKRENANDKNHFGLSKKRLLIVSLVLGAFLLPLSGIFSNDAMAVACDNDHKVRVPGLDKECYDQPNKGGLTRTTNAMLHGEDCFYRLEVGGKKFCRDKNSSASYYIEGNKRFYWNEKLKKYSIQTGAKKTLTDKEVEKKVQQQAKQQSQNPTPALSGDSPFMNDPNGQGAGEVADELDDKCSAGLLGFGWLLCPGANMLESYINGLLNWVDDSMQWTVLADGDSPILETWKKFLPIANLAFAIVFLVLVYSMATSTGLSNYEIKKILPKLIITAIAVNLSFYICAIAVDLSNIAGNGLFNLLSGEGGNKWKIGASGLFMNASEIILMVVAFFMFGGTIAIALLVIFAAVVFRQVALAVLIVVSSVAIACYMLPNTRTVFDKWKDFFIKLLLVYPMFGAVWGASHLVSEMMAPGDTGEIIQNSTNVPNFAVQFICMMAPALAIIPLFKASGGLMQMAANASQRGLNSTGLGGKMNAAGRAAGRRATDPARRRIQSGLGNAGGALATKGANLPVVGGALGRAAVASQAWGAQGNSQLDQKAMANANQALNKYSAAQQKEIATSGKWTDKNGKQHAVDDYTYRAAMEANAEHMQPDDVEKMMKNANSRANNLKGDAASNFRQSAANAARSAKNMPANYGMVNKLQGGGLNEAQYNAAYDASVLDNITNMSASDQASLLPTSMEYYEDKAAEAAVNNNDDSALQNIANNAQTIKNTPELYAKQSADSKANIERQIDTDYITNRKNAWMGTGTLSPSNQSNSPTPQGPPSGPPTGPPNPPNPPTPPNPPGSSTP